MTLIGLALALAMAATPVHPLHTTLAVVTVLPEGRVDVSVRAFADDYSAAARMRRGDTTLAARLALTSYAIAGLSLQTESGARVALDGCGVRFEADLVWICLTGAAPRSSRLKGHSSLLFESFQDQVNIVQVVRGGRRESILFTHGDSAKWLGR